MEELVEGLVRGSGVPLRAFCREARGGGGRLRHATETGKKENWCALLVVLICFGRPGSD